MSAIGGIIDSAVGAVTGSSGGTTLQDFLSQFSSSEGIWAKTIDPFGTFDVTIRFYPTYDGFSTDDKGWAEKLGDSLLGSAQGAVKNLANNVTGGLIGSIMNNQKSVMDLHDSNDDASYGEDTFMEYLAAANLIVGKQDWIGEKAGETVSPLELQLGLYCQEVTVPNIEMPSSGESVNALGSFPLNGTIVKPDSNVIVLKIVNTKVALHERIFYPWLREVSLPVWNYNTQPYTTATIKVDFTKHNDCSYVFCGCRPTKITTQQGNQDTSATNITRDVSFIFDYMMITSNLATSETLGDKLLSTGKSLVQSAGSLVKI